MLSDVAAAVEFRRRRSRHRGKRHVVDVATG